MVARLEECETRLAEEAKERQGGEKEVRAKLESQSQTLQSYMDNTADVIRKLTEVCCSKKSSVFNGVKKLLEEAFLFVTSNLNPLVIL